MAANRLHRRRMSRLSVSKEALRDRWIKEGRWELVKDERERVRSECVQEGHNYSFASVKCWQHIEIMFPPVENSVMPDEYVPVPHGRAAKRIFGGRKATEREEVAWVASALGVHGPRPEEAPSSAAWALYQWVMKDSKHEDEFWGKHYPGRRVAPANAAEVEPGAPAPGKPVEDEDAELERLLDSFDLGPDGKSNDGNR